MHTVVVVALGNVKRSSVGLTASFNRAGSKLLQVETATEIDPANGTRVTKKNFIGWQLEKGK